MAIPRYVDNRNGRQSPPNRRWHRHKRNCDLLIDLRVRDMINDAEYVNGGGSCKNKRCGCEKPWPKRATEPPLWLELGQSVVLFRKYAADWFHGGNMEDKRLVLQTVGSNSVLADKNLAFKPKIPFQEVEIPDDFPRWCAIVEALRTPEEESEAKMLIEAVRCLHERAAGSSSGNSRPAAPFLELARRKIARTGTANATASRVPHPASVQHPRAQDTAA